MKYKLLAIAAVLFTTFLFSYGTTSAAPNTVQDTMKVCPVSGEKIDGSEGAPITLSYLGKDYTFCCANCVEAFKKEPKKYIKEPLLCPIMGEPIDDENETVWNGTKYYFCCKGCIKKFNADPEKYKNGYKGS